MESMAKLLIAVLATFALAQPVLSAGADKSAGTGTKPASFVPHSRTNNHVYGSPIERPVAGHVKTAHPKSIIKKRSSSANRGAKSSVNRQ
jgi:hypothetical protein